MRRTWRKAKPKPQKKFYINQQIRAEKVFLIDETGEKQGVVDFKDALQQAKDLRLDLVEVNPTADPPVTKIVDYGQLKYEREKKAHKQKVLQKKVDTKGVRLSVRISKHDLDMRLDRAVKFLQNGQKLKIDLILKGREKAHPQKAVEIMRAFATTLEANEELNITREQDLTKQGGRFIMILVNKKD